MNALYLLSVEYFVTVPAAVIPYSSILLLADTQMTLSTIDNKIPNSCRCDVVEDEASCGIIDIDNVTDVAVVIVTVLVVKVQVAVVRNRSLAFYYLPSSSLA